MLNILNDYAFKQGKKKENIYREIGNKFKWSLQPYKDEICNYFKTNNLNGKAFKAKAKFDFVKELKEYLKIPNDDGNHKIKIAISTLYRIIKHCNVNKIKAFKE